MLLIINTGRRKQGVEKTVGKILSSIVQSNDASSLMKSKFDTIKQVSNKFDTVKTQSVLKTCNSPTHIAYSCNQVSTLC